MWLTVVGMCSESASWRRSLLLRPSPVSSRPHTSCDVAGSRPGRTVRVLLRLCVCTRETMLTLLFLNPHRNTTCSTAGAAGGAGLKDVAEVDKDAEAEAEAGAEGGGDEDAACTNGTAGIRNTGAV